MERRIIVSLTGPGFAGLLKIRISSLIYPSSTSSWHNTPEPLPVDIFGGDMPGLPTMQPDPMIVLLFIVEPPRTYMSRGAL
jgi:hypothetical protein